MLQGCCLHSYYDFLLHVPFEMYRQADIGKKSYVRTLHTLRKNRNIVCVRPPTGLFYIERDPHSRTEIGERDIVLSAQD
jgi:hypothetical protein